MKKIILQIMMLAFLLTGCNRGADISGNIDDSFETGAQQATVAPTLKPEESNFRNLKWGMTLEEVIETEGAGYDKVNDTTIRYSRIREEDYPADAEYEFADDKLSGATFYIQPGYTDNNEYVESYMALIQKFTQRYGEPAGSEKAWGRENMDDKPDQYAQAVLDGNLIWRTEWKTEATQIKLVLSRRNKEICIGIKYAPAA